MTSDDGKTAQPKQVCPSEFALERFRLGEADAAAAGPAMADHLAGCATCVDRLAALSAAPPPFPLDAVWRAAHASETRERNSPSTPAARAPYWSWLVRGFALAGVTAVAIVALGRLLPHQTAAVDLVKGGPWRLTVIAKKPGEQDVTRVASGARLSPGDRLRFAVSTSWPLGYAAFIGMDSKGVVSSLVPADGQAVEVRGNQRVLLDGAIELDQTIGPERIDLVACREPTPVARLVDAARAALQHQDGDLRKVDAITPGCYEETFWFEKVAR